MSVMCAHHHACDVMKSSCKWWPTRCNYFGLFSYS